MPKLDSWSTRHVRRVLALSWSLGLALSAYLAMAVPVAACDCQGMEPMQAYAGEPSWTIFSGTVQAPQPEGLPVLVTRWFQGEGAAPVVAIQGTWGIGGAACETALPTPGTEWIFLASRRETGELDVNLCTPHAAVASDAGAAMLQDAIATFGAGGGPPPNEGEGVAEPPAAPAGAETPAALEVFDPVVLAVGGSAAVAVVAGVLLLVRRRQVA